MSSASSQTLTAGEVDPSRPIFVPIVVGSMAFPLNKEERVDDHHTHRWRGAWLVLVSG